MLGDMTIAVSECGASVWVKFTAIPLLVRHVTCVLCSRKSLQQRAWQTDNWRDLRVRDRL